MSGNAFDMQDMRKGQSRSFSLSGNGRTIRPICFRQPFLTGRNATFNVKSALQLIEDRRIHCLKSKMCPVGRDWY